MPLSQRDKPYLIRSKIFEIGYRAYYDEITNSIVIDPRCDIYSAADLIAHEYAHALTHHGIKKGHEIYKPFEDAHEESWAQYYAATNGVMMRNWVPIPYHSSQLELFNDITPQTWRTSLEEVQNIVTLKEKQQGMLFKIVEKIKQLKPR